jgi:hypothetical protein
MNKKIEQHVVSGSSTISRIDYDHLVNNMKVYFKAGSVYEYVDVPFIIFTEIKEAKSVGKFLHEKIKGTYDFMKVTTKEKKSK